MAEPLMAARQRAAVLHGPLDVRVVDRAIPLPGPGEVLVRVAAIGICGSDLHYFQHGQLGQNVVEQPSVLGHEASGRVIDHGPGTGRHAIGTRVALEPGRPCGECQTCLDGLYNLCTDLEFLGRPPIDGTMTEYLVISESLTHSLPDQISDEEGALIEPLSVAVWACQRVAIAGRDEVLVTGAGTIGLLTCQVAQDHGATVTVADVDDERLELATRLGVDRAVNVDGSGILRAGVQAGVLIECSGVDQALVDGIAALRNRGRAVMVGMSPTGTSTVPTHLIQRHELTLSGSFRYAGTFPEAIRLVAEKRVQLEPLIAGRFQLEEAGAALHSALRPGRGVKSLIVTASTSS